MIVNQAAMNRYRKCTNLDEVHESFLLAQQRGCTEREVRKAVSQLILYDGVVKASAIETIISAALQRLHPFIETVSQTAMEDGSTILCLRIFNITWAFKWDANTLFFPYECIQNTDIQTIKFLSCKSYRHSAEDTFDDDADERDRKEREEWYFGKSV